MKQLEFTNNGVYFLLTLVFGLISMLEHWIIPIILITISAIILLRKNKKTFKIVCLVIVFSTITSYFTVGFVAKAPIYVDETTNIQNSVEDIYFYAENYENNSKYDGQVYVYEKSNFDLDNAIKKAFTDDEMFIGLFSSIYEKIMAGQILSKKFETSEYTVSLSPVIVAPNRFLIGRNIYYGFVIIEDNKQVYFIPYKLYFNETTYNNMSFTKIYSRGLRVNLEELL